MSDDPEDNDYNWLDRVLRAEPDYYQPDEGVYEFTGNRKFQSTDKESSGIYSGS